MDEEIVSGTIMESPFGRLEKDNLEKHRDDLIAPLRLILKEKIWENYS